MAVRIGRGVQSLTKLVEFFADPAAVKAAIDEHNEAAEAHRVATEEHRKSEANAKAATEELERKLGLLNDKEKDLFEKGASLAEAAKQLAGHKDELDSRAESLKKDEDHVDALFDNAHVQANEIISKAQGEAEKILIEHQTEAQKTLYHAHETEKYINELREVWVENDKRLADAILKLNEREATVAKREQVVSSLAKQLTG